MAEKKISAEELVSRMEQTRELPDSYLDGVAGGVIDPMAQSMILSAISMARDGGISLEDALALLPDLYDQLAANPAYKRYAEKTNLEEVTAFVKANW